jgi:hypothetical protein
MESPTPVSRVTLAGTCATTITAEVMPHAFLSLARGEIETACAPPSPENNQGLYIVHYLLDGLETRAPPYYKVHISIRCNPRYVTASARASVYVVDYSRSTMYWKPVWGVALTVLHSMSSKPQSYFKG